MKYSSKKNPLPLNPRIFPLFLLPPLLPWDETLFVELFEHWELLFDIICRIITLTLFVELFEHRAVGV